MNPPALDLNQAPPGCVPFPVPPDLDHGRWCRAHCEMHDSMSPASCKLRAGDPTGNYCIPRMRRDRLRVVFVACAQPGRRPPPPGYVPPETEAPNG